MRKLLIISATVWASMFSPQLLSYAKNKPAEKKLTEEEIYQSIVKNEDSLNDAMTKELLENYTGKNSPVNGSPSQFSTGDLGNSMFDEGYMTSLGPDGLLEYREARRNEFIVKWAKNIGIVALLILIFVKRRSIYLWLRKRIKSELQNYRP